MPERQTGEGDRKEGGWAVRILRRLAPLRRGHLCKDLKETRELAMEIDICGKSVPEEGTANTVALRRGACLETFSEKARSDLQLMGRMFSVGTKQLRPCSSKTHL